MIELKPKRINRETQSLLDFEDTIRLEALSLQEAFGLKKSSKKDIYIVGEGISEYIPALDLLGFKNLWDELERNGENSVIGVFMGIKHQSNQRGGNALLMYSYIDYVLNKTEADVMVFLPPESRILSNKQWGGPTYDEIIRTLEHFPEKYTRTYFVTGLFDINSQDLKELSSS